MLRRWLTGRLRLWILLLAIVAVCSACRADFEIEISVENDGSGIVLTELVLDAEASEALLDLGSDATLPLSDLAQSGWEIGRPVQDPSGQTRITAEKAFGTPTQFAEVMGELAGDQGDGGDLALIRDFVLTREQSFGRVDYALTGVIDPSSGLASFSDFELETALGRSLESIATSPPYNARPEDIAINLIVTMPGELQEDGSTGAVVGTELNPRATWATSLSDRQPTNVALITARRSTSAQVLRGVAVVAAVLAGLVAFAQLLRLWGSWRRRKPKAVKVRPTDARGRPAEQPAPEPAPEPEEIIEEPSVGYRVVALDGMGVLYREGDDVRELLVPFARERGSTVAEEDIVVKARQLSLGRMTPADFWSVIGVDGDPNELDAAYLAMHQLMPGVVKYLRNLRDSGVKAACITNDAAAWAMKLRAGHSLEGLVDPWVISGSVGVRKPDPPLFEVLRRVTGEAPASILIIDDDLDNLDAAGELGFGTAWFTADGERSDARGHDLFRSFEAVNAVNGVDTIDIPIEEDPTPNAE